MATKGITPEDVREFCLHRLPVDDPKYVELGEELLRDPVGSRVGQYCQTADRVAKLFNERELDWERMLEDWDRCDESQLIEEENGPHELEEDRIPWWSSATRLGYWFVATVMLGEGIIQGIELVWGRPPSGLAHLTEAIARSQAIEFLGMTIAMLFGMATVAFDFTRPSIISTQRGNALDGVFGWVIGGLTGVILTFVWSLLFADDDPNHRVMWCVSMAAAYFGGVVAMRYGRALRSWYAGREFTTGELCVFLIVALVPMLPTYLRAALLLEMSSVTPFIWLGITTGFIVRVSIWGILSNLRQFRWQKSLVWTGVAAAFGLLSGWAGYTFTGSEADRWEAALTWGQVALCIPASVPLAMSFGSVWSSLQEPSIQRTVATTTWRWLIRASWMAIFALPVAVGVGVGWTDAIAGVIESYKRKASG